MNNKPSPAHHKDTVSQSIKWRGIGLEIVHTVKQYGNYDHIQVYSENKIPIPITETGYRSHFLPSASLGDYEDAAVYVRAWLDHEADSQEWKKYEENSRQLTLF